MSLALSFVEEWPVELRQASEQVFAAFLNHLGKAAPAGTINLKLVDDATSAALNEQYNGNAYATDVLTFNYAEDGQPVEGELADIAISLDTARRQAEQADTPLADEVALLVLHGLLHVAGLDHQDEAGSQQLDKLQRELMTSAGLIYRDFKWQH